MRDRDKVLEALKGNENIRLELAKYPLDITSKQLAKMSENNKIIEQALTQEVSNEEVEKALTKISKVRIESSYQYETVGYALAEEFKLIRNYISNVPKDVPNQSAKDMFEELGYEKEKIEVSLTVPKQKAIYYSKKDGHLTCRIWFLLDNKTWIADKELVGLEITKELQQAITQQLKELQNEQH